MFEMHQLETSFPPDENDVGDANDPITLIDFFHVPRTDVADFAKLWLDGVRELKASPGFVSIQFDRGSSRGAIFMSYSVWDSLTNYRRAFGGSGVRDRMAPYRDGTVAAAHLFGADASAN